MLLKAGMSHICWREAPAPPLVPIIMNGITYQVRQGVNTVMITAAVTSLLTHICISVPKGGLNIVVHPKLTHGHESPYRRDYTPDSATPAVQIPANPSQIQIASPGRYKLLAKG